MALSVATFFGLYGLTEVILEADEEAARAAYEADKAALRADRQQVKALAQSIKQQNLCGVLVYLVMRSDASLSSIDYYRTHPDELRRAHLANEETIQLLDCPPIAPPPAAELKPSEIRSPHDRNG